MEKEFIFWVMGVLEDAPIPYEVMEIYFCLHRENGNIFLSFGGNEKKEKMVFNFEYYPLEAQFFPIKNQLKFSLFSLRKLLESALTNEDFYNAFQEKNLYYSLFGSKEIYKLE